MSEWKKLWEEHILDNKPKKLKRSDQIYSICLKKKVIQKIKPKLLLLRARIECFKKIFFNQLKNLKYFKALKT